MRITDRTYKIGLEAIATMKSLEADWPTKTVEHKHAEFEAPEVPADWKVQYWSELQLFMNDSELETVKEMIEEIKNNENYVSSQYGVLFWNSLKKGLKGIISQYEPF